MKNNSDKIKDLISVLVLVFLVFVSIFLVYNIDQLQDQVYERDKIISEQTDRDKVNRQEYNDLINSLNKLFDDSKLVDSGEFDVSKFIQYHNKLKDSISKLNTSLELIESNYGLSTISRERSVNDNRTVTTTSIIGSEKIDSALVLLPYFRDRLTKNKNTWTIDLTGKEYADIKKSYEDNMYRYNSLVEKYNASIKDYNKLANTYNNKVDFYRNMLKEMSKKGLVKIDSSGIDIIYTY